MLLPAQVMPFLAHEDAIVREQAVRYFEHAHDAAPLTADDCWKAIDVVGMGRQAIGLIRLMRDLPQSDASTARLLAALEQATDESAHEWLVEVLEDLEFAQLRRHSDAIFAHGDLPEETLDHLRARLELADELVAARLWEKLEAHANEDKDHYWDEIDFQIANRLVEAIARFGQDSSDRALHIVRNAGNDIDDREISAIQVFGRMRHRPALDTLLRRFADSAEDDDGLLDALQDTIPQVGGADAIAPLEALLPTLSWGKSLSGIEMLGRIKHPDAEAALLRLLDHPKRNDTRDATASALAQQCTTDGLEPLRRMALSNDYDDTMYDIKRELVACAMMAAASGVAIDVPELPTLREEVIAREVEHQRRIEAMKFDLSDDANLDALNDDLSADDFLDQEDLPNRLSPPHDPGPRIPIRRDPATPGRNDPCPCGSGKKYKKCCLNKSA